MTLAPEIFGYAAPLVGSIEEREDFDETVERGGPVHVVMGQTFGDGQTLELVKYGLVLMGAADSLVRTCADVQVSWLIADHFVTEINADLGHAHALAARSARVAFLRRLNDVFSGDIQVIYTSEVAKRDAYHAAFTRARATYDSDEEFRTVINRTVPSDRRTGTIDPTYALAELATIVACAAHVKVGPPYERLYDGPLRAFASALGASTIVGVYGTRSFPYGAPPRLQESDRAALDTYGVLPYKRDSKGLGAFRIDPLRDDANAVLALLRSTVDVRALADLELIVATAEARGWALGVDQSPRHDPTADGLAALAMRYDRIIGAPLRRA